MNSLMHALILQSMVSIVAVAASPSSSITVFSTSPNTLHSIEDSAVPGRRAQSDYLSPSSANDVVSSLSGSPIVGSDSYVPIAVDAFNKPEYNLILSVPAVDSVPLNWPTEGPSPHDESSWEVSQVTPVSIPTISSGMCAGSTSSSSFCPSGVTTYILDSTATDASAYFESQGIPSSYDATTGLTIAGEVLSPTSEMEAREMVGLINHLKKLKPKKRSAGCTSPAPTNLFVSSLSLPTSASPIVRKAFEALVNDIMSVLKARKCGATVTVVRGEVEPSSSSKQGRRVLASTASLSSTTGNNSTSGYTADYIDLYQISLWTGVTFSILVIVIMMATGGMTMNMDPILLANFKADLGDGKYD